MKTTYTLDSANDLTPEIVESIKLTFANRPVRITVEDSAALAKKSSTKDLIPKEITDTVIDILFDQLSKTKK